MASGAGPIFIAVEAKKPNTFSSARDQLLTYLAITRQLRFQENKSIKPFRVIVPDGGYHSFTYITSGGKICESITCDTVNKPTNSISSKCITGSPASWLAPQNLLRAVVRKVWERNKMPESKTSITKYFYIPINRKRIKSLILISTSLLASPEHKWVDHNLSKVFLLDCILLPARHGTRKVT